MRVSVFKLSSIAIAAIATLFLTACGPSNGGAETPLAGSNGKADASTESPTTDEENATGSGGSQGEVVLSYGDVEYTADLAFCSLTEGEDALFHGTAFDASGAAIGYLDGDFGGLGDIPYGEARIDFGATGQFESTDEFVAIGDAMGHIVIPYSSDTGLNVVGAAWLQDGTALPTATLRVTCE